MTVMAWLDGRPGDLAALARAFTGDPTIRCDDGERYYLASPSLDALFSNPSDFRDTASSLLARINGAARVLDPEYRPVRLKGPYTDSEGRGNVAVLGVAAEASVAFGMATISIEGVPQKPPPSPAPDLARLAEQHPDVAEVFGLMAGDDVLDWFTLYKVYEIVRHNVGGSNEGEAQRILSEKGWVLDSQIKVFRDSANSPEISGKAARHGRATRRGTDAMSLPKARTFISELTHCWLDSLR